MTYTETTCGGGGASSGSGSGSGAGAEKRGGRASNQNTANAGMIARDDPGPPQKNKRMREKRRGEQDRAHRGDPLGRRDRAGHLGVRAGARGGRSHPVQG